MTEPLYIRQVSIVHHAIFREFREEYDFTTHTTTRIKMEKCTPIQPGLPLCEFPAPYLATFGNQKEI